MIESFTSLLNLLGLQVDFMAAEKLLLLWTLRLFIVLLVVYFTKKTHQFIIRSVCFVDRLSPIDDHTEQVIHKIGCYFADFVAFLIILSVLNFNDALTTLLAGAGVFGIAIGFASKDLASNMISGLFICLDRTFKPGDEIQVQSFRGVVSALTFRSTVLLTKGKTQITLPNQLLAQNAIVNFTEAKKR